MQGIRGDPRELLCSRLLACRSDSRMSANASCIRDGMCGPLTISHYHISLSLRPSCSIDSI